MYGVKWSKKIDSFLYCMTLKIKQNISLQHQQLLNQQHHATSSMIQQMAWCRMRQILNQCQCHIPNNYSTNGTAQCHAPNNYSTNGTTQCHTPNNYSTNGTAQCQTPNNYSTNGTAQFHDPNNYSTNGTAQCHTRNFYFWNNTGKVTTAAHDPDCKVAPLTHKKQEC